MYKQQIENLLNKYESLLKDEYSKAEEINHFEKGPDYQSICNHALSMIPKMREMLDSGISDKLMRWIGFLQGILWTMAFCSLNELREDNRG